MQRHLEEHSLISYIQYFILYNDSDKALNYKGSENRCVDDLRP